MLMDALDWKAVKTAEHKETGPCPIPGCSTGQSKATFVVFSGNTWKCQKCGVKGGPKYLSEVLGLDWGRYRKRPRRHSIKIEPKDAKAWAKILDAKDRGPAPKAIEDYLAARGFPNAIKDGHATWSTSSDRGLTKGHWSRWAKSERLCVQIRSVTTASLIALQGRDIAATSADPDRLLTHGPSRGGGFMTEALRKAIRKKDAIMDLVACEGMTDFVTLVEVIGPDSMILGTPGAGCVDRILRDLRLSPGATVTIIMDADAAGQSAARVAAAVVAASGCTPRVANLPDGCKDINDVLRAHGPDAVRSLIAEASEVTPTDEEIAASKKDKERASLTAEERAHPTTGMDLKSHEFHSPHREDQHAALLLASLHGKDLKYVGTWNRWLCWDGRRWVPDGSPPVRALSRGKSLAIWYECKAGEYEEKAEDEENEDKAARFAVLAAFFKERAQALDRTARRSSMLILAASEPEFLVADHQEIDGDAWILNTHSGILDLKTGTVHPHDPARLCSKITSCGYDSSHDAPRWRKFVEDVLPDEEVRLFIQRCIGLALVGRQLEEMLLFCHGGGRNGKSTFFSVLLEVLGDYAATLSDGLLEDDGRGNTQHPTAIATLCGVRLAIASETEEGRPWKEARIKNLCGGDLRTARRMREDPWQYRPSELLCVHGNHRPVIRGQDEGIWRRMHLIEFGVDFRGKEDHTLREELPKEGPGILRWAMEGLKDYLANGLNPPAAVTAATQSYRDSEDILGQFLKAHTEQHPAAHVQSSVLYQRFVQWWIEEVGRDPWSIRRFSQRLQARGFERDHNRDGTFYQGLCLKP